MTRFEYQGEGVQWNTIFTSVFPNDPMNFGIACVMMLVDSVIYGLIGTYVRAVVPGNDGRRKPLWYPFLPSTWCACKKKAKSGSGIRGGFLIERETQPNPFTARMKRK